MDEIGFIGLGSMGAPMARNVADAGYSLCVYNRTYEKAEPFAEADATVCETPREAAEGVEAVITMVADREALWNVCTGEDGVFAAIEDTVLINMGTVSHETTTEVATAVEQRGGQFVDAPVSGTIGPAEDASLTVLAGCERGLLGRVEPLLSAMGEPIIHCGPIGQGTNAKLFVNLLLGNMMQGFAEALVFGDAHDLDVETMLETVGSGGLSAPLFRIKGELIREGDFEAHFPVELLSKDLGLILDAADEADVPVPVTAATRQAASATRALGYGESDMAALVRHLEDVTGTEVRDPR